MSRDIVSVYRGLFYSKLCETNIEAYRLYLGVIDHGRAECTGDVAGVAIGVFGERMDRFLSVFGNHVRSSEGVAGGRLSIDDVGGVRQVHEAVGEEEVCWSGSFVGGAVVGKGVEGSGGFGGSATKVCGDRKGSDGSCDVRDGDVRGSVVRPVGAVVEVSAKTLLNRERRKAAKERKVRKKAAQADVPEWRRKFATGDLADTWAARKVRENKLAILKADEQIKRLESGAGKPRLQSKVLTEAEQEAKIRADYDAHMQKTNADIAYWKKRQEAGAVDKAIKLEMEIMDGQISGKYDPFASRRTIGWAKTVKTNSTGGSSANKTVWSGSGASKFSSKESVISLEKHEKELKQKEKEVAYYKELFLKAKDDANKADQYWLDQGEADCAY